MVGRVLRILAVGAGIALGLTLVGLGLAHREIRSLEAPLPTVGEIVAAGTKASDLPLRVEAANTASQPMPRSTVLDTARDPVPDARYVMSHSAFLLTWQDGRRLLIDTGMDADAARAFGRPATWLGADPIEPLGSAAEQFGARTASGPLAVLITHLHTDHTQGAEALCAARGGAEIALFQTRVQAERHNYTTRPGVAALEAAECLRRQRVPEGKLAPLPEHPGVFVIRASGHTPGSQVAVAFVKDGSRIRALVFTGDVVNAVDGARHDVSKPLLYRMLVVPEHDARLGALRRLLGNLERDAAAELVVSHDQLQLEALGLLSPLR